jgi:hypothetical protein
MEPPDDVARLILDCDDHRLHSAFDQAETVGNGAIGEIKRATAR